MDMLKAILCTLPVILFAIAWIWLNKYVNKYPDYKSRNSEKMKALNRKFRYFLYTLIIIGYWIYMRPYEALMPADLYMIVNLLIYTILAFVIITTVAEIRNIKSKTKP